MIHDPDHAQINPRCQKSGLGPYMDFTVRHARVRRFTRTTLIICAISGFFVAPLRAEAGQLSAPPPTLPEQERPAGAADGSQDVQGEQVSQTPAPVMPAGSAALAPRVVGGDQLSLQGRALWDGLQDQRVSLTLNNGAELEGTIVAQSSSDLALARASDGSVVSVPKAEVKGVRAGTRPRASASTSNVPLGDRPINSGRGLAVGGITLLSFGVPFGLAGTVMLGICPGCLYIHLPLLLPGIGMIVGGSVALARAKKRKIKFREAWGIPLAGRMQLTPSLAFKRGGGEVGFALRF